MVIETIKRLLSYIEGDKEQISISAMLHEAKQVLARVLDTDLEANRRRGDEVLRYLVKLIIYYYIIYFIIISIK